jgi:hypothetical protein
MRSSKKLRLPQLLIALPPPGCGCPRSQHSHTSFSHAVSLCIRRQQISIFLILFNSPLLPSARSQHTIDTGQKEDIRKNPMSCSTHSPIPPISVLARLAQPHQIYRSELHPQWSATPFCQLRSFEYSRKPHEPIIAQNPIHHPMKPASGLHHLCCACDKNMKEALRKQHDPNTSGSQYPPYQVASAVQLLEMPGTDTRPHQE